MKAKKPNLPPSLFPQHVFRLKSSAPAGRVSPNLRLFAQITAKFSNVLKHRHIVLLAIIPKLARGEFLL